MRVFGEGAAERAGVCQHHQRTARAAAIAKPAEQEVYYDAKSWQTRTIVGEVTVLRLIRMSGI